MLVSVEVRERKPDGLEAAELRDSLFLDFVAIQAAGEGADCDAAERRMEVAFTRCDERGQSRRIAYRRAVDENDVASDGEVRMLLGCFDRGWGLSCVGHHGGRGQHAGQIRFDNGAIDSTGQAEVVGVKNEAAHRESLAAQLCGAHSDDAEVGMLIG